MSEYITEQEFKDLNFAEKHLPKGEYEDCVFQNCNFAKVDISNISFEECEFSCCDFSNAEIQKTAFRTCLFAACKMLGLHFEDCNPFLFGGTFDGCDLSYASFFKMDLTSTLFRGCNFTEVDFAEANLNEIEVKMCNFLNASFENTNLKKTDFRGAVNFNIDPEINQIQGAKFHAADLQGLLRKYNIEIY